MKTTCARQGGALAEIGKSKEFGDAPTGALVRLLAKDPELAACADPNGYTLLHHAVRITSSLGVLKLLANAASLSAQNRWKRTVLHQACGFGRPPHVILFLAERFAQALEQPDEYGLVPLHYACWKGMDEEVIARLIGARPTAVRVVSVDGETPLFSACECESRLPTAVYARLLREWPVAAAIVHTTDDGRRCIPLRRAVLLRTCEPSAVQLLTTASVHVLVALVQSVLHESSSARDTAKKFLRKTILRFHPELHHEVHLSASRPSNVFALARSLRSHILCRENSPSANVMPAAVLPLLEAVFHERSMQDIVRAPAFQAMICGLARISSSVPPHQDHRFVMSSVLESSSGNVDCLYLCLKECPDPFFVGKHGNS